MSDKVFLYARTSTDGQELGLDKQLEKMREYADSQDYDVEAEYSTHVSGMKKIVTAETDSKSNTNSIPRIELSNRPTVKDIYLDCSLDDIDKLIVYDPSRLARRMRTELILEHLFDEIGVEIEYLNVSDSWIGKQVSTLINEYEVRQTRERTKDALEQKQKNDEWVGRPPTGFKTVEEHNKLVPEDWLKIVVRAVNAYQDLDGASRNGIAENAYGTSPEVTAYRMRQVEQNMEKNKPAPKYVKGERPY